MTAQFLLDQYLGQKNIVAKGPNTGNFKIGEVGFVQDAYRSGHNIYYYSGALVEVMICMATATLSSPAGKGVKFDEDATAVGKVGAFSTSSTLCDGIVDPNLSGSLASGDTFLVFRKGPMNIIASGAISAGAGFKADNSGKFQTSTDSQPTRRGRVQVAASADGDSRRAWCDFTAP